MPSKLKIRGIALFKLYAAYLRSFVLLKERYGITVSGNAYDICISCKYLFINEVLIKIFLSVLLKSRTFDLV